MIRMNPLHERVCVAAVCMVVLLTGCSTAWRAPIYQKRGFQMQWIDKIAILPPVDGRIDKATAVDVDGQMRQATAKILTKKGYATVLSDSTNGMAAVTGDDLADPDEAWVRGLGAPGDRWVLIVRLVDVTSSFVFLGATGNAELAGYMYDKKDGTLVWRDKGAAQVGQGSLLGIALKGEMADDALNEALDQLLASFPERTKLDPYIPEPVGTRLPADEANHAADPSRRVIRDRAANATAGRRRTARL